MVKFINANLSFRGVDLTDFYGFIIELGVSQCCMILESSVQSIGVSNVKSQIVKLPICQFYIVKIMNVKYENVMP